MTPLQHTESPFAAGIPRISELRSGPETHLANRPAFVLRHRPLSLHKNLGPEIKSTSASRNPPPRKSGGTRKPRRH